MFLKFDQNPILVVFIWCGYHLGLILKSWYLEIMIESIERFEF